MMMHGLANVKDYTEVVITIKATIISATVHCHTVFKKKTFLVLRPAGDI